MNSKKTGILTFHNAINHGAVLQAYALKKVCDGLGYETHIIDYSRERKTVICAKKQPLSAHIQSIKLTVRKLLGLPWEVKREKAFRAFRSRFLDETAHCDTADEIRALGCSVLISGSDQIWNYKITGNKFDPVYFGSIDPDAKSIVYAASAQDTPFPLDKELEFSQMLKSSNAAISIREKKLADYAACVTGNEYEVVLDPTLIADIADFDAVCAPRLSKKPYILLYQIDRNPSSDISVKALCKHFGMNVYTLTAPRLGSVRGRRGDCGPLEFISYIKHAEFIVTNSFHGLAFSTGVL